MKTILAIGFASLTITQLLLVFMLMSLNTENGPYSGTIQFHLQGIEDQLYLANHAESVTH